MKLLILKYLQNQVLFRTSFCYEGKLAGLSYQNPMFRGSLIGVKTVSTFWIEVASHHVGFDRISRGYKSRRKDELRKHNSPLFEVLKFSHEIAVCFGVLIILVRLFFVNF